LHSDASPLQVSKTEAFFQRLHSILSTAWALSVFPRIGQHAALYRSYPNYLENRNFPYGQALQIFQLFPWRLVRIIPQLILLRACCVRQV
jgi:hypothetical protein